MFDWKLKDEEYDKLNPPILEMIVREEDKKVFIELLNDDNWLHVGCIPTPKNEFQWFVYNFIHGLWMKYPIWKVILFSIDKKNIGGFTVAYCPEESNTAEKKYIIHNGWLGKDKVEVEVIELFEDKAVVKALQGCPFDMWRDDSSIPSNAHSVFRHDTYWFDSKIVRVSQIMIEKNDN